jgi:outer membrane receptor protein involved in Fe transport
MNRHFASILLAGTCSLAVGSAHAQTAANSPQGTQGAAVEEVVVTGSRVITNGNSSPTPVTIVSMDELVASKPTTVFEALLEMPLIAGDKGGKVAGGTGQGGNNNSIAALNLRGLGPTRGLVLYDGHRVSPQNLDGTVDLNQIPQLLLQRVDTATGGSSAVYGSDAITGVVNFVTNRNYNGLKFNAQAGITARDDDPSYELGVAYGTPLLDGRGHFEGSIQYHNEAGLKRTDRSYIQLPGQAPWSLQGNGCAAGTTPCVPYFISRNIRDSSGTFGGKINTIGTPANPFNGYDFTTDGVATPFVGGTAVGVGTNQIGGNGGFTGELVSLVAKQDFTQAYGRFDYDLTDDLHFYLTSFYDLEHQFTWLNNVRANGSSASSALAQGFKLTVDNAFLPASMATAMRAAGVTVFNLGKFFPVAEVPAANTDYTNRNFYLNTGLEGKFGDYKWEASYTYSRIRQANISNESWNSAKLFAALDSVLVNGQPTCWVLTQAQYAANFQGCVPMNIFGPTATTQAMQNYVLQPTRYVGATEMKDLSGSIAGSPFSIWAGPVNTALSAEWRRLTYGLTSQAEPANVTPLDCNGLGLLPARTSCVQQSATNVGTTTIYPNGTAGRTPVTQEVAEGAGEADVPLLKDMPYAQALDLNLAARYASYQSTGSPVKSIPYSTRTFDAVTWKVGLDWQVNDWAKLRGTRSRDFRAPNLNDLYLPGRTQGLAAGTDFLTGAQIGVTPGYTLTQQVGGNPNLKPEVGYTWTGGVVLSPLDDFSLAVDYYDITIDDAITVVDGSQSTIQNACYDSGGSSPYCSLQVRPGGFSRTPANQALSNAATLFYTSLPLNIANVKTDGLDIEANYRTEIAGRPFSVRALATYQPHLKSVQPGTPTTDAAGVSIPKLRISVGLRYDVTDEFTVNWSTRWRSELANVDPLLGLQVAAGSATVASVSYSNLNLSYHFNPSDGYLGAQNVEVHLNVQNVFDQAPPPYAPLASGSPFASGAGGGGVGFYPADDAIGRAFFLGARVGF